MGPLKQLALLAIVATFATSAYAEKREGKSIGIFNIVKFDNVVCDADNQMMNGTCYTAEECSDRNGVASGSCAEGYGVCCVITLTCGSTSNGNCTYLQQAASTTPATDSDDLDTQCSYRICPASNNVNRIRLDFAAFNIAGPGAVTLDGAATAEDNRAGTVGQCTTDTFSVGNSPVICGSNMGQHMIVDTDGSMCVTALFSYGVDNTMRSYTIHVTQYDMANEMGGPPGCLQFFTGATGTVSTFNWQTPTTSIHLANQHYDVCVRKMINACIICWSPITTGNGPTGAGAGPMQLGSFGINNGDDSDGATGKSAVGAAGCRNRVQDPDDLTDSDDSVFIPGGIDPGPNNGNIAPGAGINSNTIPPASLGEDIFCGRYLNAVAGLENDGSICTRVTPFKLGVSFDNLEATGGTDAAATTAAADETGKQETSGTQSGPGGALDTPLGISGFSLGFMQHPC